MFYIEQSIPLWTSLKRWVPHEKHLGSAGSSPWWFGPGAEEKSERWHGMGDVELKSPKSNKIKISWQKMAKILWKSFGTFTQLLFVFLVSLRALSLVSKTSFVYDLFFTPMGRTATPAPHERPPSSPSRLPWETRRRRGPFCPSAASSGRIGCLVSASESRWEPLGAIWLTLGAHGFYVGFHCKEKNGWSGICRDNRTTILMLTVKYWNDVSMAVSMVVYFTSRL